MKPLFPIILVTCLLSAGCRPRIKVAPLVGRAVRAHFQKKRLEEARRRAQPVRRPRYRSVPRRRVPRSTRFRRPASNRGVASDSVRSTVNRRFHR